ncbi:MAG: AAA family ATPase [Actinobacteria bacterium]|nr:AAA family ATPase [Actinomycetota bacterium]
MTAVGAVCRSCGATPLPGSRFCAGCGSPLAAASQAAEYRQVTVLFADVVRSMQIAATLDVERLREIMAELVERSAAAVRRRGGAVQHTGDGVMGLFGAPMAFEDHAFRACLAALDIQVLAGGLAREVARRDGVALQVRVGLNSGRVIAGDVGSGSLGYGAFGEPVGVAQRMQSAAAPGGVLLSVSTARLVEHRVALAEPEWVYVKGSDEPVQARRLVAIRPWDGAVGRIDTTLVGRRWEMAALEAMVDRTVTGRGGVVSVVGPPGIGKSRVAREAAELASNRAVQVCWGFCESHTRDVPFHAVARLLRAGTGVADLDGADARARLRDQLPGADPQDLLLLDDLLGIADPGATLPTIDPEARRRRLTALVNTATRARAEPALFIIEDAQWIDAVSEAMLADFLDVMSGTAAMVLITSRPEYHGALTRVPAAETIVLAPLDDSKIAVLLSELLGADSSVTELAAIIVERAAGNPFFAEEMVRELAQRGVLTGERGRYACHTGVADVAVPATVQAAIAARIDRLSTPAKRTVNGASVVGMRFEAALLTDLDIDPAWDELLDTELIEQTRPGPNVEYVFRHPLIRTVAYESQLKSDRAQWHRRLATAIQDREPDSVEENSALIAEHLQAAGDVHAAYAWHMRAAAWSVTRDVAAARVSWERAREIADGLPADEPGLASMRIAPRTMLRATDWQARSVQESHRHFVELRQLCMEAGDTVSLAVGMSGVISELLYAGRSGEGARLASEQVVLLESIGDPDLTTGLAFVAFATWFATGAVGEILRWSQTVIDLADGDATRGAGFGVESPLAIALAFRGVARCWLGIPGWRHDFDEALAMARDGGPATLGVVVTWTYGVAIAYGVLPADDTAMSAIEESVCTARRSSSDLALIFAEYTLGSTLLNRDDATDRRRGLEIMAEAREWQRLRIPSLVPLTELLAARERARLGDHDAAISAIGVAIDELHQDRLGYEIWGIGALVEALLDRCAEGDLAEAQEQVDRLATLPAERSAIHDITVLRLRTLLARARGDDPGYRDLAQRYRAMAETLGYQGHIAWASAMVEPSG